MDNTLLVPGKITGFRIWDISYLAKTEPWAGWAKRPWGSDSYLLSVNNKLRWNVEKIEAKCQLSLPKKRYQEYIHGKAPSIHCHCGIYATYTLNEIIKHFSYHDQFFGVFGAISGWGRTILASKGFRCQYAKIEGLVFNPNLGEEYMVHVARLYRVPLLSNHNSLRNEFPSSNLSALGVDGRHGVSILYPPF